MEKKTKTLLFTNIQDPSSFSSEIKNTYDIKEVYNIPNNNSLLFVIFYNIKDSDKCYKEYISKEYNVHYTISKYELPKDQEKCDKNKNQSTLFITLKNITEFNESLLNQYGEVKDIRNANQNTKCVEFYDSRSADKCYNDLMTKGYQVKYVWDMSTKTKWDIIRNTDNIISQQIQPQKKRKVVVNKNMFIKLFDEFISENIEKVYKNIN